MKDIFDLEKSDDLPSSVKLNIKGYNAKKLSEHSIKLIELFEIKKTLSVDEIIVGLYRKFNIQKTRVWVSTTAYNLIRANILKKHKLRNYVTYELIHKGKVKP